MLETFPYTLPLAGGLLIGLAATLLLLLLGRVAGISGILWSTVSAQPDNLWRWTFLVGLVEPRQEELLDSGDSKDPKTRLQEWLQARGRALPDYSVVRTEGAEHERRFVVACRTGEFAEAVIGEGSSRRRAEQEAAMKMLVHLETEADG